MPDFEIRLANVVDVDIDTWEEDNKEPIQSELWEELE